MSLREFEIIARYFHSGPVARRDVLLGIGDDAAVLGVAADHEVVTTIQTLTEVMELAAGADPEPLGHRALALPLSRLAARGAEPAWATLALTLPAVDEEWLDGFSCGLMTLAKRFNVQLVGGDTTQGPLSITTTVSGLVPRGEAVLRGGAQSGDLIYVTGTLGEAGLALLAAQGELRLPIALRRTLQRRLERPEPRVQQGQLLRPLASATHDLSQSLAAELGALLEESGVGATLYVEALPLADEVIPWLEAAGGWQLPLFSEGDHELCFTVAPAAQQEAERCFAHLNTPCTWIGIVEPLPGVRLMLQHGELINLE
jgi:thiamine-monophosphate kinase